jgi:hypothetical protein
VVLAKAARLESGAEATWTPLGGADEDAPVSHERRALAVR